jgi:hypothetical protein
MAGIILEHMFKVKYAEWLGGYASIPATEGSRFSLCFFLKELGELCGRRILGPLYQPLSRYAAFPQLLAKCGFALQATFSPTPCLRKFEMS